MLNKQLMMGAIKFNKTIFDNAFKAMTMAQEQCEKMLNTVLDQASWLPADGKKTIQDWLQAYKNGCVMFKFAVDEQYKKVEEYFSNS